MSNTQSGIGEELPELPSEGKDSPPPPVLTDRDLQVVEEMLKEKIQNLTDYVNDDMMEGQSYLPVARKEIARLTPVLEHVQAELLAR